MTTTNIKPINPSKWIFEAIYKDNNVTTDTDMDQIFEGLMKGRLVQTTISYDDYFTIFYINVHGTNNYKSVQTYTTIIGSNYELVSDNAESLYNYMSNNGDYDTEKHNGQIYTTDSKYKDNMDKIMKMLNPTACEKIMNYIKKWFNVILNNVK